MIQGRKIGRAIRSATFVFLVLATLFSIFDFFNLDALTYKYVCGLFNNYNARLLCPDYYDIKYWEGLVSIGTLLAAYFSYQSLKQTNKGLVADQKPFVVLKERIYLDSNNRVHGVSLKNMGKGLAHNIIISTHPVLSTGQEEFNEIVDDSNPSVIHLSPGESHSLWALDNRKLIRALNQRGYKGENIIEITDLTLSKNENQKLKLYLHYRDSLDNEYITVTYFERSESFIKVVKSDYWGMRWE